MTNANEPLSGAVTRHHLPNQTLPFLLLLWSALLLEAAVIDDFSGPTKKFLSGGAGMDFMRGDLVNGQLVLSGDYPGPSSTTHPLTQWDNVYWPNSWPAVNLNHRTLELRIDLVSISTNDVYLGFGIDGDYGGYGVFVDQDEFALFKYSTSGNAAFCWTNAPVTNQNLRAVLTVTQMSNTVQLAVKFFDLGGGGLLYERSFFDGPGRDFEAVTPRPKGMTLFGPDTGAAFTSFHVAFAGVFQWATNDPPPLEVVVDNLQYEFYDAPELDIAASALLSWPENTAEGQIVVGADSLSAPVWTPWPEPIFKRNGRLCISVPAAAEEQFFKLVPGTQFVDDFSEPSGAFATRNAWVPYFFNTNDQARFAFELTNGTFRIHTLTAPLDGRVALALPIPVAAWPMFRDFSASVDILSFTADGDYPGISIAGRGTYDFPYPGTSNGYLGGLNLNPNTTGIWDGTGPVWGPSVVYDRTAHYRLKFSAVGTNLTLHVVNLRTGHRLEQSLSSQRFTQGYVSLLVNAAEGASYDITLDNFMVTGTKP